MANNRQKTKPGNACHSRVQTSAHNFLWPENCISSQYINWQPQFVQAYQDSGMGHSTCSSSKGTQSPEHRVWGSLRSEEICFCPGREAVTITSALLLTQLCTTPYCNCSGKYRSLLSSLMPVDDYCPNYHCNFPSIFFLFTNLLPLIRFFIIPSTKFLPNWIQELWLIYFSSDGSSATTSALPFGILPGAQAFGSGCNLGASALELKVQFHTSWSRGRQCTAWRELKSFS